MKKLNKKTILYLLIGIAALTLLLFLIPWIRSRPIKNTDGSIKVKDNYVVKETTISSKDEKPDTSQQVPQNLVEKGRAYKLVDTQTEVINKEYSKPYEYEVIKELSDSDSVEEELTVPVPGYGDAKVKFLEKDKIAEVQREPERIEYVENHNNIVGKPKVESSKTIDYYDETTQTNHQVFVTLEKVETVQSPRWVNDLQVPLTFNTYDAGYYDLYGLQVMHNDNVPDLAGKEQQVIKLVGLDSNYYKLNSFRWDGAEYTSNGNKKRNAIANGSRLVGSYKAIYANNEVQLPSSKYKTRLKYISDDKVVGDVTYKLNVKSIYAPAVNFMMFAPAALGVAIFCSMFLIYLSKNKKNKGEQKNEI